MSGGLEEVRNEYGSIRGKTIPGEGIANDDLEERSCLVKN